MSACLDPPYRKEMRGRVRALALRLRREDLVDPALAVLMAVVATLEALSHTLGTAGHTEAIVWGLAEIAPLAVRRRFPVAVWLTILTLVAALGTFLPCYLFTVIPAPYFKRYGKLPSLVAFVDGVTAAAIGAISGAAIVLAKRSIVDVPSAILAVITLLLLWKLKKLPEPVIVAGAAIVGLIAYPLLHG